VVGSPGCHAVAIPCILRGMARKKPEPTIRVYVPVPLSATEMPEGFVSLADAARFLGVARETLRRGINQGTISAEVEHDPEDSDRWRYVFRSEEVLRVKATLQPLTFNRLSR
jgi:hypothetical protein